MRSHFRKTLLSLAASLPLLACEREERNFQGVPLGASSREPVVQQSRLEPGPPTRGITVSSPYDDNAYGTAQGKRLYSQMNCVGCHSQGGGGIGPPLMDDEWIYGSAPENIFQTIVQGRPNGMPSFGGKIPVDQIWQLVSYVRSMSGLLPKDVAPGRNDAMYVRSQEQATEPAEPVQSFVPPASERP
jgi:cytochrome c oxidase cbb3-type subunit III